MALIVDKYMCTWNVNEIRNIKFFFHENIIDMIIRISNDPSIPNLLFYGPSGSGKKSLITLLIKSIYNENIYDSKFIGYELELQSKKIIYNVRCGKQYFIVEANKELDILQLIKSFIDKEASIMEYIVADKYKKNFTMIVILNVENLQIPHQMSLRRTIELYNNKYRFIFSCNNIDKLIQPLKSRCTIIRVPQPSNLLIGRAIQDIIAKESIKLPIEIRHYIISKSNGNVSHALLLLELYINNIKDGKLHECNPYDIEFANIIEIIKKNITESTINILEDKINTILSLNINGSVIIDDLLKYFIVTVTNKYKLIKLSLFYSNNLLTSRKDALHLKNYMIQLSLLVNPIDK